MYESVATAFIIGCAVCAIYDKLYIRAVRRMEAENEGFEDHSGSRHLEWVLFSKGKRYRLLHSRWWWLCPNWTQVCAFHTDASVSITGDILKVVDVRPDVTSLFQLNPASIASDLDKCDQVDAVYTPFQATRDKLS